MFKVKVEVELVVISDTDDISDMELGEFLEEEVSNNGSYIITSKAIKEIVNENDIPTPWTHAIPYICENVDIPRDDTTVIEYFKDGKL